MSVALARLDFGVFLSQVPLSSVSLKGPLSWGSTPLQSSPWVHRPTRLSPFSRQLSLTDRVRLSWSFPSLRRFSPRCPVLPRPAKPTAGDESCHALAGAALGLFQPLGGLSCSTRTNPSCPVPVRTALSPRPAQPYSVPLTPLGFSLQSFPLSKSRAASRRPFAPLRVRRLDTELRREGARDLATGFTSAPPPSRTPKPPKGPGDTTERTGPRLLPIVRPPVHHGYPQQPRQPPSILRTRRLVAGPPASKPCSLRESVHRRPCSCSSLRPNARATTGPLLSWDCAPLKLAPPRPRVSVDRESARRAVKPYQTPPEGHAPLRTRSTALRS